MQIYLRILLFYWLTENEAKDAMHPRDNQKVVHKRVYDVPSAYLSGMGYPFALEENALLRKLVFMQIWQPPNFSMHKNDRRGRKKNKYVVKHIFQN